MTKSAALLAGELLEGGPGGLEELRVHEFKDDKSAHDDEHFEHVCRGFSADLERIQAELSQKYGEPVRTGKEGDVAIPLNGVFRFAVWEIDGTELYIAATRRLRSAHPPDVGHCVVLTMSMGSLPPLESRAIPPPSLLSDDAIELRLIRVMGPANATERPADEQFLALVPEYRFAIHRLDDGLRVGRIHIHVTNEESVVRVIGHCGYAVGEAHRRKGYATRAVKLIVGLARYWNVMPLWILIEPDNIASRGTVERAGFVLVDIVDSSAAVAALGVGAKVCRYRILE